MYCHAPVLSTILSWIDKLSPGTYQRISTREFSQIVEKRIQQFETSFTKLKERMGSLTRMALVQARRMLRQARMVRTEDKWRQALNSYNNVCVKVLSESDPLVENLRGIMFLKDIMNIHDLPADLIGALPDEGSLKSLMAKASILKTLPDFYDEVLPLLARTEEILSEFESVLRENYLRLAFEPVIRRLVETLIQQIKRSIELGFGEDAIQFARELALLAVENGLTQKSGLIVNLTNPHHRQVNAKPEIAVSEDGEDWKIIYDDEPFHIDDWTIQFIFLVSEKTSHVRINNKHWIGWFNLDLIEIRKGRDKKLPGSYNTCYY